MVSYTGIGCNMCDMHHPFDQGSLLLCSKSFLTMSVGENSVVRLASPKVLSCPATSIAFIKLVKSVDERRSEKTVLLEA